MSAAKQVQKARDKEENESWGIPYIFCILTLAKKSVLIFSQWS